MVESESLPTNGALKIVNAPTPRDKFISVAGRAAGVACFLLAFITCILTVTTLDNKADTHGPYYIMAFIFANVGLWLFIIGNNARKKIVAEEIRIFEAERERRRQGPPTSIS